MTHNLSAAEARWLKVGTFNVHGLGARAAAVHEILSRERMDVFVLTETMVTSERTVAIYAQVAAISNNPLPSGGRVSGGVAICVRHGLRFETIKKKMFDRTQIVVIKIAGAYLGGIYSPPGATWRGFEQALDMFNSTATGKAILLGDFNARHRRWCYGSNARGRKLVEWATRRRWVFKGDAQLCGASGNDKEMKRRRTSIGGLIDILSAQRVGCGVKGSGNTSASSMKYRQTSQ